MVAIAFQTLGIYSIDWKWHHVHDDEKIVTLSSQNLLHSPNVKAVGIHSNHLIIDTLALYDNIILFLQPINNDAKSSYECTQWRKRSK